jgi:membrane-bound serine protease (ClpP class)
LVLGSITFSFVGSIWLSQRLFQSSFLGEKLALQTAENTNQGFVAVDQNLKDMIGKTGKAATVLRPSGKVEIDGCEYDAKAEIGFIDKGTLVKVIRNEAGQLYVVN